MSNVGHFEMKAVVRAELFIGVRILAIISSNHLTGSSFWRHPFPSVGNENSIGVYRGELELESRTTLTLHLVHTLIEWTVFITFYWLAQGQITMRMILLFHVKMKMRFDSSPTLLYLCMRRHFTEPGAVVREGYLQPPFALLSPTPLGRKAKFH